MVCQRMKRSYFKRTHMGQALATSMTEHTSDIKKVSVTGLSHLQG